MAPPRAWRRRVQPRRVTRPEIRLHVRDANLLEASLGEEPDPLADSRNGGTEISLSDGGTLVYQRGAAISQQGIVVLSDEHGELNDSSIGVRAT